jgi:SnoaL-like domain
MPWAPELFSAPALQRLEEKLGHELSEVPFFDGLMTGELDAVVGSFADEPELHHPVRGRIRGARAFATYLTETNVWLSQGNASIEHVSHVVAGRRGFGEAVIHLDGESVGVDLPVAIVTDRHSNGGIDELRMYYSSWPLTGRHANRPPLLQPDPELRESDVVAEYQCGLSAGDANGIVATFEPDGYAREPAGGQYVHVGIDGLRAFYERLFSNDGGIELEHCGLIDDKRACALEYNVVRCRSSRSRSSDAASWRHHRSEPPLLPLRFWGHLVPAVEGRVVAGVPGLAQPGSA